MIYSVYQQESSVVTFLGKYLNHLRAICLNDTYLLTQMENATNSRLDVTVHTQWSTNQVSDHLVFSRLGLGADFCFLRIRRR